MKRTLLLLVLCLMPAVEARAPRGAPPPQRSEYEEGVEMARDFAAAWEGLRRLLDSDRYLQVSFTRPRVAKATYALVDLSRHGAVLTLKFENIDDDDDWFAEVVRAHEVQSIELRARPF